MTHPLENIRLTEQDKERLIILKRTLGLTQWNELCRWAFCISLAHPEPPTQLNLQVDSSVEMTWKTFGGAYHEIYLALLRQRVYQDGFPLDDGTLRTQFRLHLHRGIAAMFGNPRLRSVEALAQLALPAPQAS